MKQSEVINTLIATTHIDKRVIIKVETPEGDTGSKEISCINEAQAVAVEKLLKSLWGVRQA
jgi:hypothetical protein